MKQLRKNRTILMKKTQPKGATTAGLRELIKEKDTVSQCNFINGLLL